MQKLWKNKNYIRPNEPAVTPTAKKKENSNKSLGRELTINLNWVILPCAPQVCKFLNNLAKNFNSWE